MPVYCHHVVSKSTLQQIMCLDGDMDAFQHVLIRNQREISGANYRSVK